MREPPDDEGGPVFTGRITLPDGTEREGTFRFFAPPEPPAEISRMYNRWWSVSEPKPAAEDDTVWLEHAIHGRGKGMLETSFRTVWRRVHRPALCGYLPPGGCWNSIGTGWNPEQQRRTWRAVPGFRPLPCAECERRTLARTPAKELRLMEERRAAVPEQEWAISDAVDRMAAAQEAEIREQRRGRH